MKILFIILLNLSLLISCNEEEDIVDNAGKSTMTCQINGTEFVPNVIIGNNNIGSKLSLSGVKSSGGEEVSLLFTNDIKAGTYNWSPGTSDRDYFATYARTETMLGQSSDTSGNFTIIEHDTAKERIRGTFSFVARADEEIGEPAVTVTDGKFDVYYKTYK